jgi:hypothetical protein
LGEVGGDHDGGIRAAQSDFLESLVLVEKDPFELGVLSQLVNNHVTGVDEAQVASGVGPLVEVYHGNADVLRVLVGVPVCQNVEPSVEGGNYADAQCDDDGHRVAKYSLEVSPEDPKYLAHAPPRWVVASLRA